MSSLRLSISRLARLASTPANARTLGATQRLAVPTRAFSSSITLWKKARGDKGAGNSKAKPTKSESESKSSLADIKDFSVLESSILRAIERLTHDLSQLRAGGQLSPEIVEALPVMLASKQKARLSDFAQVVQRGRFFHVILHDPADDKSVRAAILASPHSLVPEKPEEGDEQSKTIRVRLPPISTESRQKVLHQASKSGDLAQDAIKDARLKHHKLIRSLTAEKKVRSDDAQIASKKMEEVVKNGNIEVKRLVDGAVKVLQGTV